MSTKTKLIILVALILVIAVMMAAFGKALECGGNKDITYSPMNLSVGQTFNIRYIDYDGGVGQQVFLNWTPSGLVIVSGNNPATLFDFGMGEGTYVWQMNSTLAYNYTVQAVVLYENNCTVTRYINIPGTIIEPQLNFWITAPNNITAKTRQNINEQMQSGYSNIINNSIAYNITGTYSMANGAITPNPVRIGELRGPPIGGMIVLHQVNTSWCGTNIIDGYADYYDTNGNLMPRVSATSNSFDIFGSDLVIDSFTVSDNDVKEGDTVTFRVNATNLGRNTTINAVNAVVRIYRGTSLLRTITLGNLSAGQTANGSVTWSATTGGGSSGDYTINAIVDSNDECSNWNNNNASLKMTITTTRRGGGGGGGGGGGEPICGNGICEGNEASYCPQDCIQQGNQTNQSQSQCTATTEDITIVSDDGMALLKIARGTKITLNGNCIMPKDIVILKADGINYPVPEGTYLVRGFEFLPDGTTFDKDAQVIIKYNEDEFTGDGFIITYDKVNQEWKVLSGIDDKEAMLVTASTKHFTDFALATKTAPGATGASIWDNLLGFFNTNPWFLPLIIAVIVVLALISYFISKRKKRK